MRYFLVILLLATGTITAGCISGNQVSDVTPDPQVVYVTVLVNSAATQMMTTAVPAPSPVPDTTKPVETPSLPSCPAYTGSRPLSSPVVLNGIGDGLVFFKTAAPGKIRFNVTTYSPPRKDESCTDSQVSFQLAGTTTCNQLNPVKTGGHFTGNTTLDLPFGGRYSVATKGCYGWELTIAAV